MKLRSFAVLVCFILLCFNVSALALQATAPAPTAKPPAAPTRWRSLIGEYERDGENVIVLEDAQKLVALFKRTERAEQGPRVNRRHKAEQNRKERIAPGQCERDTGQPQPQQERDRRHEKPRRRHRHRVAAALIGQGRRGVGHRVARGRRQRYDNADPCARMRRHIDCSHRPPRPF